MGNILRRFQQLELTNFEKSEVGRYPQLAGGQLALLEVMQFDHGMLFVGVQMWDTVGEMYLLSPTREREAHKDKALRKTTHRRESCGTDEIVAVQVANDIGRDLTLGQLKGGHRASPPVRVSHSFPPTSVLSALYRPGFDQV